MKPNLSLVFRSDRIDDLVTIIINRVCIIMLIFSKKVKVKRFNIEKQIMSN